MKNYHQQKKSGFLLNEDIYRKTRNDIRCYQFLRNLCGGIEDKNPIKIKEGDVVNKIVAEKYIKATDEAIKHYVPTEYQDAIWEHVVLGMEYEELEEKYFFTTSAMKQYTQSFVWGVAHLLGEDFTA